MVHDLLYASAAPETLGPIRIGAMAVQPAPDVEQVYVGLASLLPSNLRVCSSAGLFFARVLRHLGDQVVVVAGALPRYVSYIAPSRQTSVLYLSAQQMEQMLEWDRRLAGLATCDVQEVLEDHVKSFHCAQQPQQHTLPSQTVLPSRGSGAPVSATSVSSQETQHQAYVPASEEIDLDQINCVAETTLILPLDAVRGLPSGAVSRSSLPALALRAALQHLRAQRCAEKRWKERKALKEQELRIRRLYRQRHSLPLHRFVEITPIYGRGKYEGIVSCRIDIDVLAA